MAENIYEAPSVNIYANTKDFDEPELNTNKDLNIWNTSGKNNTIHARVC